nr:Tn3 family transposase [Bacillus cereus]
MLKSYPKFIALFIFFLTLQRNLFYNVFQLTKILHEYIQEGNKVDEDVLSDLSPYLTFHVNRFGKYKLDSNRRPPDIEFDIPVSLSETEEAS